VEPGTPKYPAFTGKEPCASIGSEMFCTDEKDSTGHYIMKTSTIGEDLLHMIENIFVGFTISKESEA